jgi:hypothetical protein
MGERRSRKTSYGERENLPTPKETRIQISAASIRRINRSL